MSDNRIRVRIEVEIQKEGWEWRSMTNEVRMELIQNAVAEGAVTYIEEDVD